MEPSRERIRAGRFCEAHVAQPLKPLLGKAAVDFHDSRWKSGFHNAN